MKHSEREHLKENELAKALAAANQAIGQHQSQYLAIGGGIVALLVAVAGYTAWSRNADNAVSGLLAEAMVVYEAPVQAPIPPVDAASTGGTGADARAPIRPSAPSSKPRCRSSSPPPTPARAADPAGWPGSTPHRS